MTNEAVPLTENDIEEIAVIGLAGRFPGAKNVEEFWQNLRNGVDSVSRFTDQELATLGIAPAVLNDPNYVKAKGALEGTEFFDAYFFGYSPGDAEIMDPQHRIFLETAWEALEDAGYDTTTYSGPIGVFAGASINDYIFNVSPKLDPNDTGDFYQKIIGNEKDFLATRVSYKLNLRGPSLNVQTGCSTSLVAVQLACQSLLNYQCSVALAGGVCLMIRQKAGYFYHDGGIPSPDGYCRAFDAKGQGTVLGEGVGIVVLKRLSEALADGDNIYAVIKGIAINNDGSLKVGFTAPSVDGQAEVITMAQTLSGVGPETISYIEAHGTGTPLGDPIEIEALKQAFNAKSDKRGFCAMGSVKTNIGHLDTAAGVASLIKTVLALKHKEIPPSLYFEKPNPNIDFENSPFYINTELSDWKVDGFPRRAGVSSFGIGGTNVHAVLEEAPIVGASDKSRPWQLLLFSAQTSTAFEKMTINFVEHLKQHPDLNLADVAYTLQVGRQAFNHRRMLVCQFVDDAVTTLEAADPQRILTSSHVPMNQGVVFMFSGQGSQYVNMGLELYRTESVFREEVERCCEILQPHLGLDLRDIMYPDEQDIEDATQKLTQTFITQPALFTIEYALAKLWMSWGVHPEAMVGHSIGEYVAACLAGVFPLEDALSLVATRGRLIQELPGGSMLAVPLSEKEVQPFLNQRLSLSNINSPSFCVISGEKEAIEVLKGELSKKSVDYRPLHTSHAFHSEMMDPILDAFTEQVKRVSLSAPQIPFVSNLTGTWITSEEAGSPDYWAKHVRHTVRFSDCVQELLKEPGRVFLEVGPGHTLSTFVRQHLDGAKGRVVLSSVRHPKEERSDIEFILSTLGRLWLAGIQVDWSGFYKDEHRHRVSLPTYPFERQRYWIEPQPSVQPVLDHQEEYHKKSDIAEWFYVPSWKRSLLPNHDDTESISNEGLSWLIFLDEYGLGDRLVTMLQQKGHHVITVKPGEGFQNGNEGRFTINPKEPTDYHRLLQELRSTGHVPDRIVHLWRLTGEEESPSDRDPFEVDCELGFNSLLFLAQAIGEHLSSAPIWMKVVQNNLHDVTGDENLSPEKAIVIGPCRVIPQEYPNVKCSNIDIELPKADPHREKLTDFLMQELLSENSDSVVAYRGKHRWVQTFEPVALEKVVKNSRVRQNGVYLITGGLGGIGLVLAEHLAQTAQARLILVSRKGLPERNEWERWIESHGEEDKISRKIRKVESMEKTGSEVIVLSADVTDANQMKSVLANALDRFGQIHGVIHAAGIAGGGIIQLKTLDAAKGIMAPKVKGTLVLESLLSGVNLDFFFLCSALDSVLGEIGQVDYCAANAFLDAYAQKHHLKSNVVAANWYTWREVGMAVDTEVPLDMQEQRARSLNFGIGPDEGKEAFDRILSSSLPQVLVSTRDISAVIEESKNLQGFGTIEKAPEAPSGESRHPRPTLSSVYIAPGNKTEQTVAEIWQQLLRVEKVGIHDNFFELGGHSLLATQVISRLRRTFPVELSVAKLFENPTVHLLSKKIMEREDKPASFEESKRRGQRRKERKLQRMTQGIEG